MHWLHSLKLTKTAVVLGCLIAAQVIAVAGIPSIIYAALTLQLHRKGLPVDLMVVYNMTTMIVGLLFGGLPDRYKPHLLAPPLLFIWVGSLALYVLPTTTGDYMIVRIINGLFYTLSTHALIVWVRNKMPISKKSKARLNAFLMVLMSCSAGVGTWVGVMQNYSPLLWEAVVGAGAIVVVLALIGLNEDISLKEIWRNAKNELPTLASSLLERAALITVLPQWGSVDVAGALVMVLVLTGINLLRDFSVKKTLRSTVNKLPTLASSLLERNSLIIVLPNLGVSTFYWSFITWLPPYIGEQAGNILFVCMVVNGFASLILMFTPKLVVRNYRMFMGGNILLLIGTPILIWINESFWLMAAGVIIGIARAGISLSISVNVQLEARRLGKGGATSQFIIDVSSIIGPLYLGLMGRLLGPAQMWLTLVPLLLIAAILLCFLKLPTVSEQVLIKSVRECLYVVKTTAAHHAIKGKWTEYILQETTITHLKATVDNLNCGADYKSDKDYLCAELYVCTYGLIHLEAAQIIEVDGIDLSEEIDLLRSKQTNLLTEIGPEYLHSGSSTLFHSRLWNPEDGVEEIQQNINDDVRDSVPKPNLREYTPTELMLQYLVAVKTLEITGLYLDAKIKQLQGKYQLSIPGVGHYYIFQNEYLVQGLGIEEQKENLQRLFRHESRPKVWSLLPAMVEVRRTNSTGTPEELIDWQKLQW